MEDEDLFRQPYEGLLNKFTNVVKGWQYRWFVLDPTKGVLEYYLNEEGKKQKPRGSINLTGAVVSPSDEDSQTFMVNAANSEVYRLRAQDAKERQLWVSRLRCIVQRQRDMMVDYRDPSMTASSESLHNRTSSKWSLHRSSPRSSVSSHIGVSGGMQRQPRMSATLTATQESLRNAKDILIVAEEQQKNMVHSLEALPTTGPGINSLDHDCLLLKATSQATMECLEDCLTMLQRQELTQGQRSAEELELSQSMANISASLASRKAKRISVDIRTHLPETRPSGDHQSANSTVMTSQQRGVAGSMTGPNTNTSHNIPIPLNYDDEVPDTDDDADKDLGGVEEHKSIILHLLSQLKLGMDLTKVVLPTFILERRSLLEMFADFMALPHMFARIPSLPTPEARMLAVVEYYLSSFHVGRKGSLAKKPYNPILGETFHCSWDVPSSSSTSQSGDSILNGDQSGRGRGTDRVTFVAEQVSHHPPVSAFYAECAAKRICMNASVWTKSKFLGMSIGVNMIGECAVHVLDHGETYTLTFPNAYGRSILTIPWMELGGKVLIQCPQSSYTASVVFHTKPFYGGKVHRLSAEVKNPANQTVCKVQGEWNGTLEFNYSSGEHKVIDTSKQCGCPKKVRPISMQGEYESRRLWQNVTASLKAGNINTATEHKRYLEERQRQEKKLRMETNTAWRTKLFSPAPNNGWVYNHILKH